MARFSSAMVENRWGRGGYWSTPARKTSISKRMGKRGSRSGSMEAERQSTRPSHDASFAVFTTSLPSFIPAISDGLTCILNQAAQVSGEATGTKIVVAMLTGGIAEDLQDVVILCARD